MCTNAIKSIKIKSNLRKRTWQIAQKTQKDENLVFQKIR